MDDRANNISTSNVATLGTVCFMTEAQIVKNDTLRKYGVLPSGHYKAPDTNLARKARKERARMLTRQREAELLAGCDGSCLDHPNEPNYCKAKCEVRKLWKAERKRKGGQP